MNTTKRGQNNNLIAHIKENKHHYRKSVLLSLAFVVIALVPVIFYASASITAQQAAAIQQKNADIESAILNNDYTLWASLETDDSIKSQINASNFNQFADAYRLLQQGKLEEANIIKKTMALKEDFQVAINKSALIENAISEDNYTDWRNVVGTSYAPNVDANNFPAYAQASRLIMAGKIKQSGYVKARANLKEDLGISSSR